MDVVCVNVVRLDGKRADEVNDTKDTDDDTCPVGDCAKGFVFDEARHVFPNQNADNDENNRVNHSDKMFD